MVERTETVLFKIKFPCDRRKELKEYLKVFGKFQWSEANTEFGYLDACFYCEECGTVWM